MEFISQLFAPFVAGVAAMSRTKFTGYNVIGAFIWALIIVPGLMAIFGAWKAGRAEKAKAAL